MLELHLPWLELAVLTPLIGVGVASFFKDAEKTRLVAILFSGLALALALGAWEDFNTLNVFEAHDRWDLVSPMLGRDAMVAGRTQCPVVVIDRVDVLSDAAGDTANQVEAVSVSHEPGFRVLDAGNVGLPQPWGIIVLMGCRRCR